MKKKDFINFYELKALKEMKIKLITLALKILILKFQRGSVCKARRAVVKLQY